MGQRRAGAAREIAESGAVCIAEPENGLESTAKCGAAVTSNPATVKSEIQLPRTLRCSPTRFDVGQIN